MRSLTIAVWTLVGIAGVGVFLALIIVIKMRRSVEGTLQETQSLLKKVESELDKIGKNLEATTANANDASSHLKNTLRNTERATAFINQIAPFATVLLLLQGCGKGTSNNIQNKDENQQDNIEKIELIKVSGAVIDGYIDNSIVFLDENKNYILDKNEIFTNTNIDGKYQLSIPKNLEGNIVAIQGVDTISGKKNTFTFSSNLDFHDNQSIFLNGYTTLANINNIRNDKYNFDITSNLDIFQKSVKIINSINLRN